MITSDPESGHRSSDKKVAANRANSKKSSGPRDTTSTRFNAAKHGLLSAGITELDDADGYRHTLCRLEEAFADEMSVFLIEHIALQIVRLRRIKRLEAEYITSILNPPIHGDDPLLELYPSPPLVDPGLPTSMDSNSVGALVGTYQRYESSIENKLYRAMNQLERIRRTQQGEHLPAPVAVDVGVHSDHRDEGTNAKPVQMARADSRSESPEKVDTAKESA